jgi:hypothetical protein
MTKQTKTTPQSIGEQNSATLVDFDYTALGILISSYKANGVHIANEEKYWELYEKELQIAFNSGRASALSELSKG